jgi:hypothetical protein
LPVGAAIRWKQVPDQGVPADAHRMSGPWRRQDPLDLERAAELV